MVYIINIRHGDAVKTLLIVINSRNVFRTLSKSEAATGGVLYERCP